jgi:hypothetical protein
VDQDGRVALADTVDELVDPAHRGALPDDPLIAGVAVHRLAQSLNLVGQAAVLDGTRHAQEEEGLRIDGFGDEVVRPHADRADRRLQAPLPGDDNDGHVRTRAEDSLAQVEAAHLRHAEIGEDNVEVLLSDQLECALGVRRRRDLEAVSTERQLEHIAGLLLIVDDQDVTFHLEHL